MSDGGVALLEFASLIAGLVNVYIWVVIIAALLSFVNPDPYNPIVQFLHRVTEPAYSFVRRHIKTYFNGLDLAPLVIVVALELFLILFKLIISKIAYAL